MNFSNYECEGQIDLFQWLHVPRKMNILVACEESQAVTKELRKLGHRAFSCDIQECSGGHPEWHIKGDVLPLINGRCEFELQNGDIDRQTDRWDILIAFPPCTHLAVSGARHFEQKRADGRQEAGIKFFSEMLKADCEKIAVENPVNIIGSDYLKKWYPDYAGLANYTQKIQPYEYGSPSRKATCLWLKGLPYLHPTDIVKPEIKTYKSKSGKTVTFSADYDRLNGEERGKHRSKTYPGIAKAMAEQWAGKVEE